MIRSQFLTHWIGRHIATDAQQLAEGESNREKYVECAIDVLTNGMYMTVQKEQLRGWADAQGREVTLLPGNSLHVNADQEAACTCFTETRLSQSKEHSSRYGMLGFVFTRQFVFKNYGGPVHYVRGHSQDVITGRVVCVLDALLKMGTEEAVALRNELTRHVAYMKSMSRVETDDFAFLDENEWRIAYSERAVIDGTVCETGQETPPYRVWFAAPDLQMLILPDKWTRKLLVSDERFRSWLTNRTLQMLTIEEASHL